jgi:hypothetical protein
MSRIVPVSAAARWDGTPPAAIADSRVIEGTPDIIVRIWSSGHLVIW